MVASQLLDTIPPLPPRYAAHDISERSGGTSLPQEVKNKKRKIYVQSPVFPPYGMSLAAEPGRVLFA